MTPIYFIVLFCSLASAQRRSDLNSLGLGDSSRGAGLSGLGSASGHRGSLDSLHQGHLGSAAEHALLRSDVSGLKGLHSSGGLGRGLDHGLHGLSHLGNAAGLSHESERYGGHSSASDHGRLSGHGLRGYRSQSHLRELSDLEHANLGALGGLSDRQALQDLGSRYASLGHGLHDHNARLEDDLLSGSEAADRRHRPNPLLLQQNQRSRPLRYRPSRLGPRHPSRLLYRGEESHSHLGDSLGNLGDSAVSYRGQGLEASSGLDDAASSLGAGDSSGLSGRSDSGLSGLHGASGHGLHGVSGAGHGASGQRAESDSLRGTAHDFAHGLGDGSSADGLSHSALD